MSATVNLTDRIFYDEETARAHFEATAGLTGRSARIAAW